MGAGRMPNLNSRGRMVRPKPWYGGRSRRKKSGCYVATAVYGSYDCPQVWVLRRYRDYTLSESFWGRMFIRIYYAVSPIIVKLFGRTKWFNNLFRKKLNKMVYKLQSKGYSDERYEDIDW